MGIGLGVVDALGAEVISFKTYRSVRQRKYSTPTSFYIPRCHSFVPYNGKNSTLPLPTLENGRELFTII